MSLYPQRKKIIKLICILISLVIEPTTTVYNCTVIQFFDVLILLYIFIYNFFFPQQMDEYCLYFVRITQKAKLPCLPEYLPLLWYFFKPHTFSKSTRVIPMLEYVILFLFNFTLYVCVCVASVRTVSYFLPKFGDCIYSE